MMPRIEEKEWNTERGLFHQTLGTSDSVTHVSVALSVAFLSHLSYLAY